MWFSIITMDMIFFSAKQLQIYAEESMAMYYVSVDLKKVFDTVNRMILWEILRKLNCTEKFTMQKSVFFFLMFCNVPYFMHYIIFFSEIYFADMGLSYMSICLLCWQIRHAQIQFFAYTISYNIFNIISLYWCVGVFLYVGNLYVGRLRIKKNLIFINVNYLLIHFI